MPVTTVKTRAQKHIPSELLQVRTVHTPVPGQSYVMTVPIDHPISELSPTEQDDWFRRAAAVTQHLRQLLKLGPHETLEHIYPQNYHERNQENEEIVAMGAMTYFPFVRHANGELHRPAEKDIIWIDSHHRPWPLTEEDFAFTGSIAMQTDELGGGWVVNLLVDEAYVHTPRDRMSAREMTQPTKLPTSESPLAENIQEAA